MNSFNLIQALMSFAFLITFASEHMSFITLMIVNMFVFNIKISLILN
jgi:hypothetical protein